MCTPNWLAAPTLHLALPHRAGSPELSVTLEALGTQHAEGLAQHAEAQTVAWLVRGGPTAPTPAAWAQHIDALNALPQRVNFAVLLGGEVAGRISYSEVNISSRWVEVGTMLTPPFLGGAANPAAKLLLLTRAFEVLQVGRVQFKVDERNGRSVRAMHKLGATREGTLRSYQVRADGSARNSVVFSVLPDEWPTVKAGLLSRLASL